MTSIATDAGFAIVSNPLSIMTLNSSVQYLNPLSTQNIKVSSPIFAFCRQENRIIHSDGEELVLVENSSEQWRIILGPIRNIFTISDLIIVVGDNNIWEIE